MSDLLSYTVTFLEMVGRPSRPPAPRPSVPVMLLRCDTPSVRFYRYLYASVGDPWLWFERRLMPAEDLAQVLADPKVSIHIVYRDGEPIGYFELNRSAAPTVDLAYFGLMPNAVGQGIGPWLLDQAIAQAFDEGASVMTVNTCTLDSPRALPMYQRAGFVPVRREERTVENPRLRLAAMPKPACWIEIA
ncbi:MAG: GNAT family N-acetyltransferase [Alphaproteobacteria bacterium]|nr:GNAT family N-acetyltransferase [Alphaproteobacteria bacterium]